MPIGDLHVGHKNYRESVAKKYLSQLCETTRGVLLGDLAECATKTSVGKGTFDTTMTPEEQRDYLIELLYPYRDYIDGGVSGTHEERLVKDTTWNIAKDVCRAINVPFLNYSGFVKYAWNGVAYSIYIWHGSGHGTTAPAAIKTCEDIADRVFADVYVMGHLHKLIKSDRIIFVPDQRNMKVQEVEQHFVVNGSCLAYDDGYAEMQGLTPRKLGFANIRLRGVKKEKEIKVTI